VTQGTDPTLPPEDETIGRAPRRRRSFVLIPVALAAIAVAIFFFLKWNGSNDNAFGPVKSHTLTFPSPRAKNGAVPTVEATVAAVIHAPESTCWRGFVLGRPVEGCGSDRYTFTGTSTVYGANARKTSGNHDPIELELLIGGHVVDKDSTSKPFGLVSVNGETAAASPSP
jgi:hypothetical protein